MDACALVRERLVELGLDQKDLAAAAEVTESYISQLLTRKKSPPAPNRTDIYEKMEAFLKLPRGRLSDLAELQRTDELRRNLGGAPVPLNEGVRDFVLFKCRSSSEQQIRAEFEKHAFGPIERLVTQRLMDVAKDTARQELHSKEGIHAIARLSGRSFEETRTTILDFLDADLFNLTAEHCETYLDPLIESWAIDFVSFRMDIVLNHQLSHTHSRRFEFVETGPVPEEPGFKAFLRDRSLSGDATAEELAFLRKLRFAARRPSPYYYYRELQNLRDPLHFRDREES
jgi:transcriptional regulator with XRE-family HTH domain